MNLNNDKSRDKRYQIKQRYNRRFYLAAHVMLLFATMLLVLFQPSLSLAPTLMFAALIPHALYVAYLEYQDWLTQRVDDELYRTSDEVVTKQKNDYATDKQKRGKNELDETHFDESRKRKSKSKKRHDDTDEFDAVRDKDDDRRRKRLRSRRDKDDSDEFSFKDIKKALKKIEDIID